MKRPDRVGLASTICVLTLAWLSIVSQPLAGQSSSFEGCAVMERYAAQERTADTEVTLRMTLVDSKGRERHRSLSMQTMTRPDGTRMQLIRFLDPADVAGTGFLSIQNPERDDDAWLYLPALRRTRRIVAADRRDHFVGTDFTFEDLDPEVLERHSYRRVRDEVVDGVRAWLVEATPTGADPGTQSGYGRRELWLSQDHDVLIRAKLYDAEGAYVRTLEASDVRQVPGTDKWRPYRIVMTDVQKGTRTVLEITEYRVDQGLDPSLFTEQSLRRGAR